MKLLGLGGSNGSGKDTVGHMLEQRHEWRFITVTELLRDEARKRGLEPSRENLREISAEWRRKDGYGVLVERAIADYEAAADPACKGLVIASLRHPAEAEAIQAHGGHVLWTDADPRVRYERIQANIAVRGRVEEDQKTFEEFVAEELAEMKPLGDGATLNMAGVKERADLELINNGTSIEAFMDDAEQQLASFL